MLSIRKHNDDCRHLRMDANESVFFARQLEYVKSQVYPVLYAELSAFRMFPIDSEGGPGAKTITYRSIDEVGAAKIVAGYGDDLPRVGVKGKEVTSNIRSIGASYGWSLQDIRAAMMAGTNLSSDLAMAAARAHNRKINDIAWFGDDDYGLDGIQSISDIPSGAAATGNFAGGATAAQIITDVNTCLKEIISTSKDVHRATVLAMPPTQFAHLASTPRSDTSDTTILSFLRDVWPGVSFESATELEDWSGSNDAMIAFQRDPSIVQLSIPQAYEELPVQQENLEFKVPTHSRCGGIIVRYPKAFNIKTGI
jgi:hypothetical protein